MNEHYIITVERVSENKVNELGGWTIIEKRPLTKKEADDAWEHQRKDLKEVYGYPPAREIIKTTTVKVFEQVVSEPAFDLKAVIMAVNKER
jgi:hypothetical protein